MAANEAFSNILGRMEVWELQEDTQNSLLLWVKVCSEYAFMHTHLPHSNPFCVSRFPFLSIPSSVPMEISQ